MTADNNALLVLEVLRQDSHLKMGVFEQKDVASTIRHYSQNPVSFSEINILCKELILIQNKAGKKGSLDLDSMHDLKKTAQLLWEIVLTRVVKDKLRTSTVKNLFLILDEELINIPWELLYDGKDFLSLKFNMGRSVRTKEEARQLQYRSPIGKPKMLILANPTNDLKSAYQEGLNIKNRFDKNRDLVRIDFKSQQIDSFYVKKNLHDYDIVHFAGHCEHDEDNFKNTGWVLSDGRFTVNDILVMGETVSLPFLVFSNACQSARAQDALVENDYQEKVYNLASAFVFSGVRHYIGSIRRIEDSISMVFSKEFYDRLLEGRSVGESLRLSRLRLIRDYGADSIFWASYLLYGDPNFILFSSVVKKPKAEAKDKLLRYKKHKTKITLLVEFVMLIFFGALLYFWLPTVNPTTLFLFHKSQQLFLKGKNQEAIAALEIILKKDSRFLATYSLLGDLYQRLGRTDEALKNYSSYAFYSQKRNDKNNLTNAYLKIGWLFYLKGEYNKAFEYYHRVLALSRENKDKLNEAVALRKLALWYMDQEDNNKALEFLTKSSEINRERQRSFEHKYSLACDYFDLGLLFTNKEDIATAKDYYQKSQKLFQNLKLKNELSDYYFNLGELYLFDKQYQKALEHYLLGLKIDLQQDNKPAIASDYNMLGELYTEMGNFKEAQGYFDQAVITAQEINARPELANAYYNLGLLYKLKGNKNKAWEYLRFAEEIYRTLGLPDYQKVKKELLELNDLK